MKVNEYCQGCLHLQTTCVTCGRIVCEKILPQRLDWILNEWVSVKDRFPEEGTLVLIYRKDEPLSVDYMVDLSPEHPIWACLLQDEMYKVTHWMTLPKPPK